MPKFTEQSLYPIEKLEKFNQEIQENEDGQ